MWLAGGGAKPGRTIGETDGLGFNVTKDQVHIHDLHATMLRLLGFDHTNSPTCFTAGTSVLRMFTGKVVQPCWPEEPMAAAAA
jgi:hypothetical protein